MILTRLELEGLFGMDAFDGVTDELWAQTLSGTDGLVQAHLGNIDIGTLPRAELDLVKNAAVWIARYKLQDSLVYDEVKDKALKDRYNQALQTLQSLRKGTLSLASVSSTALPVMTAEKPRGWGNF
jgi:phage gp36-like protein